MCIITSQFWIPPDLIFFPQVNLFEKNCHKPLSLTTNHLVHCWGKAVLGASADTGDTGKSYHVAWPNWSWTTSNPGGTAQPSTVLNCNFNGLLFLLSLRCWSTFIGPKIWRRSVVPIPIPLWQWNLEVHACNLVAEEWQGYGGEVIPNPVKWGRLECYISFRAELCSTATETSLGGFQLLGLLEIQASIPFASGRQLPLMMWSNIPGMNVHGFLFKLQCLGQLCFEVFVVSIYAEEHLHTLHMSTFSNLQAMLCFGVSNTLGGVSMRKDFCKMCVAEGWCGVWILNLSCGITFSSGYPCHTFSKCIVQFLPSSSA